MKPHLLILGLLLMGCLCAKAQTDDFGTECEVSYGFKPWRGGEITLSEELRMKDNSRRYAKSETGISLQHALLRKELKRYDMRWRIGAGYSFINRQNWQYELTNQHRLNLQTSLSKDLGQLRLGFRTRYQSTWRNSLRGCYKENPQNYLRTKLSVRYNLTDTPWQVELSEEFFLHLSPTKGTLLDESRTVLSTTYDISKHQSLSIYGKMARELQVANPETYYCLGLSLSFN